MPSSARQLFRDPAFVVSLVIAVVVALGFGLVVPVLPLFIRAFDVGLFAVTAVIAAFSAVRLVSSIYTGGLADRIGASSAVGYGAIIVAVSSIALAAAPNYWAALAARGVGGFGSALFFNALLTHVVRIIPADMRARAVGVLQGAFLFGISFGPVVGGLLAEPLGLRWPFVIYGGFCGAAGLVALMFLRPAPIAVDEATRVLEPEDFAEAGPANPKPHGLRATVQLTREFGRDSAFVAALVMMAASRWAATGVRFSLVSVFGTEVVRASASTIGWALGLAAAMQLLVLWPVGRVADTVGRRAVAVPAYLFYAVVATALALATTVPLYLVVLAFYGVGTGFTSVTPPAIVADVAPAERTGLAVGVLNTAGDLGSVVGPLASGWLAQSFGYGWGFGASGLVLAIAALVALTMRETLPTRQPPATPAAS